MSDWTAKDLPVLDGCTAVVTGATSGIGLVTARELARAGATVLLACRNAEKADAVAEQIRLAAAGARVESIPLDLTSLASVERCADGLHERLDHLDLLVNNAGVMAPPLRRTQDGFELQFGTNHLGHFALTGQVLDLLLAAPAPRVTNVASSAHRMGKMRWDDLNWERSYSKWPAYGQSKLANLLFTFELQRRAQIAGSDLLVTAAHPGYTATHLQAAGPEMAGNNIMLRATALANGVLAQSAEMGALPTLYAATMDVAPGAYLGPDGPLESRGHPKLVGTTNAARDAAAQQRLWEASEELTAIRFAFSGAAQPS